jgi:hypothetical protein
MVGFAVFCSLFLAVPVHATTTSTFSDGTFASGSWSAAQCEESASGQTFGTSQATTGGNPGDYKLVSETTVSGAAENVALIYLGGSFTPATDGAITNINWSLDAELVTAPGLAGLGAWCILEQGVDQNGHPVIFQSNNINAEKGEATITSTSWATFGEQLLNSPTYWTSNQKVSPGAPLNPNFTTGGTITFGFETSSDPGSGTNTYSGGFDNFQVDVTHDVIPSPEPVTLSLLAIGGLSLLRRRNK